MMRVRGAPGEDRFEIACVFCCPICSPGFTRDKGERESSMFMGDGGFLFLMNYIIFIAGCSAQDPCLMQKPCQYTRYLISIVMLPISIHHVIYNRCSLSLGNYQDNH